MPPHEGIQRMSEKSHTQGRGPLWQRCVVQWCGPADVDKPSDQKVHD